uniref:Uncharacterized protein n=1 Tax=Fagus sylvatica TaxID=28930 RepID=A0A2N9EC91_FAGSY
MELLKMSKFKLQLQALVTEVRELRERERSASEQLRLLIQKQKQTKEEYGRKLQELQAEFASCNELRQKLERKVNYLQNDNALLENKQKELKGTIQILLQSKESFVNAYEKTLSAKDVLIQNLISEKEALHSEVGSLGIILQKIQETVTNMNQEDKRVFSSILECEERCDMIMTREDNRTEDVPQSNIEESPSKASAMGSAENTASPLYEEYKDVAGLLQENNNNNSCVSEATGSEPQFAANVLSISVNDGKDNCKRSAQRLDSECSTTTQAEASEDPG